MAIGVREVSTLLYAGSILGKYNGEALWICTASRLITAG
jgi:hypothetical protein